MKKIFASMMAAAMVVSLAGCSNGNSSESGSSANSEGSSDNAAAYKLGMGGCNLYRFFGSRQRTG